MEKVLEVYNNIKDRLSNPFVFSFICSWLVYNWRIPVALIRYDKSQFSGCGCTTIFDFISFELAKTNSLLFPLFFAFVYSLGIPYVKNFFRIVSALAQKWGENEEIKALDGGKISFEKYLKLREEYKKAIKNLEDVSKEEKEFLTDKANFIIENKDLRSKLDDSETMRNSLNNKIEKINNNSFLNGSWKVTTESIDNTKEEVEIYIENGTIHSVNNKVRKPICQITDFYYDESNNRIIFLKDYYPFNKNLSRFNDRFKINRLNAYDKSMDKLSGFENYDVITYVRYKY